MTEYTPHREPASVLVDGPTPAYGGWTREWPTEEGWYWFYGNSEFDRRFPDKQNRLVIAQARRGANSLAVYTEGQFLYQNEGWEGWWHRAEVPALPEEHPHG